MNINVYIYNLGLKMSLLNKTQRHLTISEKIDAFEYTESKNFSYLEDIIKEVKYNFKLGNDLQHIEFMKYILLYITPLNM